MLTSRLTRILITIALVGGVAVPASATGRMSASVAPAQPRDADRLGAAAGSDALSVSSIEGADYVPGEVLVSFEPEVAGDAERKARVHERARAGVARGLKNAPDVARVVLGRGVSVADAIAAYRNQPGVAGVQPNYIRHLATVPNDPLFSQQWGLHNTGQSGGTSDADVDAPEAWDRETGSDAVIVAVIDTGVDYTHPDLAHQMWVNVAEQNGSPGVDDDGNGYVDDIHGIDVVSDDGDPLDTDPTSHGTHCAGTIGASGDNTTGIAGVNRDVRLMAIRAFGGTDGTDADAIEAIRYATRMGADVINCSWVGPGGVTGDALYKAIAASPALFSCAAGNTATSNEQGATEIGPLYPASYDLANIVSVAATNRYDHLAFFSNYGATSVDLAAPGQEVTSTVRNGLYKAISGTSMAAPFVSGAAALLKSNAYGLTAPQLRATLMRTVDKRNTLTNLVASGGRLNIERALAVTRLEGADRYAVAAGVARSAYPRWEGVEHVIVACGDPGKEADPLTAGGLAGVYDAPILLTKTASLPSTTRSAISAAAAACLARGTTLKVHLVGGTASIPDARWTEIAAISGVNKTKDRISGSDRYAVSAAIANRMISVVGTSAIEGALIVNAESSNAFYDALAASPISAAETMPMLAVRATSVPAPVARVLNGRLSSAKRYAASGSRYLSSGLVAGIGATRLATSSDRYVASSEIARAAMAKGWLTHSDTAITAKLPDALTGGAFLGKRGGVLLFTDSSSTLRTPAAAFATEFGGSIDAGWVLGGPASVTPATESAFRARIH